MKEELNRQMKKKLWVVSWLLGNVHQHWPAIVYPSRLQVCIVNNRCRIKASVWLPVSSQYIHERWFACSRWSHNGRQFSWTKLARYRLQNGLWSWRKWKVLIPKVKSKIKIEMKYFNLSISIFLLRGGTRGGGCEEFKYLFFINDRLYKIYNYALWL